MFSFVPDAERLSQIFSQAIAPTFFPLAQLPRLFP